MSSKKQLDALGDRMKTYERHETDARLMPNLPIYVRLDGRGFSKFTKKMTRPYDKRLSDLMQATTEYLVKEFSATIGYVQSDEISLVIKNEYPNGSIFEGKIQKLVSTLASSATAFFNANFSTYFVNETTKDYCERLPTFDCRIFSVPSWDEAANAVLWRYLDAIKNSKQMLAQHYFSHKELQGLNGKILVDKLKTEKNIIWENYPEFFKSGVFVKRYNYNTDSIPVTTRSTVGPHPLIKSPFHNYSHEERVDLIQKEIEDTVLNKWYIVPDIEGYDDEISAEISVGLFNKYHEQLIILLKEERLFEWYMRGSLQNEWGAYKLVQTRSVLSNYGSDAIYEYLSEKAAELGMVELAEAFNNAFLGKEM